jgi:hypothetical protein
VATRPWHVRLQRWARSRTGSALHGTRARNIGFAVVARSTPRSTQPSPAMVAADCQQPQAWLAVMGFADALGGQ